VVERVKITALEVIPYRLALQGELKWGRHSRLTATEHCLVRVRLEDGTRGTAEAPPRPSIYGETLHSIRGIIKYLEPRLCDLEIEDAAGIKDALSSVPNNNCAKGALDMALWDARVKVRGSSLMAELGGLERRIPASYILGIGTFPTMLLEARRVYGAGVRVLKVKVGRDTTHDLEVIHALKTEFGDTVTLYADSNETLSIDSAPLALEQMRSAGVQWVEEPLPVRQIRARSALQKQRILPIIADDSCFTPSDLERELEFETFDILNIKTARNGFTDSLAMMQMARNAGKGVMIGSQASTTLGTIHAGIMASRAEVTHPSELSFFLKLETEITTRVPRIDDGSFDLEDALGIALDDAKLETARIA
jgi:L-Ala-D/L-Glu epimerase